LYNQCILLECMTAGPKPDDESSPPKWWECEGPKQGPRPNPDHFWLLSGGIDSVASFLLTKDALRENYRKSPVAVYLDTRIGLPAQRLYVEHLCDQYDVQLWTLRTQEKFEDRVAGRGKFEGRDDAGAPGPALHSEVQNELKGRQREKLARLSDKPVFISGIRAEESEKRAAEPKGEINQLTEDKDVKYVKPAFELSKKECVEIILRHEDCPINPAWLWTHYTDCGCQCNGDPSELDNVEDRFPWFAQRMREYEEAADADGVKDTLGWGGLSAEEQRAREQGQTQTTLDLCGDSCGRKRLPPVKRALEARLDGATPEEAIAELYEPASVPSAVSVATDGGKP